MADAKLEQLIRETVRQVLADTQRPLGTQGSGGEDGVFPCMDSAIRAAQKSQQELSMLSLEKREELIHAMRNMIRSHAEELARMAVEETGMGRYADKVQKNLLAARKTPGTEDIAPRAYTGDDGMTLVERAPYGVIGAITPSTNPSETVICNGIGMIAAGNSVVFNPHPGAKRVTQKAIRLLNQAIVSAGGPHNLLVCAAEPNAETGQILMKHPAIRLLVVTGGPEIVRLAMHSGKKAIAAGPGNPPTVVDETADIAQAAKCIVDGASFDNNLLCIAEKETFVVSSVADRLKAEMVRNGAYEINAQQLAELMKQITVTRDGGQILVNKKFVGKDAAVIMKSIGMDLGKDVRLIIAEVEENHPLVQLEQLMPVMPIVRARDVEDAIAMALRAEHQNYHTATMHSMNVANLSRMAKCVNTSIFVKNAPSYSGLGFGGEGHTTYTIASPTGEGLTSAITFTRQRRCVLKDQFRIV